MLASHSAIYSHPEPHLITPLYYLGYYATVDRAPYDHVNAAQALRELTEELPRGEADYLDALRAYTDTLYGRVLGPTGKGYFLDKTPAYALVLPFLAKLYPDAKYVVLTRHPFAVMHSVAHSFFGGDYAAAEAANPIVARYVPAIGRFLLDAPVPYVHVRYEDLVQAPETQMRRILDHIGVRFEPAVVDYGSKRHMSKSYGDPVSVEKHRRPVTDSMITWAQDLSANAEALALAQRAARRLEDAHLQAWGYPRPALLEPLGSVLPQRTHRARLDTYQVKRQVLLTLRKNVHDTALG
ncbi:MAG TPA: sulfotransferase, partial [Myxococcota bacterium]|nr:sulfotransferase [Myxococcota bacterium]